MSKSQRGFTLVEVMVVLFIMGLMLTLMAPRAAPTGNDDKQAVRKIILVINRVRDQSRLTNSTYRLVFRITGSDSKEPDYYWVERASRRVTFDAQDEQARKDLEEQKRRAKEDKDKKVSSAFHLDSSILKKPEALRTSLKFVQMELEGVDRPVTKGEIALHFLPEGLSQEAVLQIKMPGGKLWSIAVDGLTGKGRVVGKGITLKEWTRQ